MHVKSNVLDSRSDPSLVVSLVVCAPKEVNGGRIEPGSDAYADMVVFNTANIDDLIRRVTVVGVDLTAVR